VDEVTNWKVRDGTPEDADAVGSILTGAFPEMYASILGVRPERASATLARLYRNGWYRAYRLRVAEESGQVVGVALTSLPGAGAMGPRPGLRRAELGLSFARWMFGLRIPRGRVAYLDTVAVAEAHRTRGAGGALVRDFLRLAEEHGCDRAALHVLRKREGARRLYERMGFRAVPEERLFARLMALPGRLHPAVRAGMAELMMWEAEA
jgi:GNAT superfamily N-acetyltransferase